MHLKEEEVRKVCVDSNREEELSLLPNIEDVFRVCDPVLSVRQDK
jgi:hypothetical protein